MDVEEEEKEDAEHVHPRDGVPSAMSSVSIFRPPLAPMEVLVCVALCCGLIGYYSGCWLL